PAPAGVARGGGGRGARGVGGGGAVPHPATYGVGRDGGHLRGGAHLGRVPGGHQAPAGGGGARGGRERSPAARGGGAGPLVAPQRGRGDRPRAPRGRNGVPRDGAAPRRVAGDAPSLEGAAHPAGAPPHRDADVRRPGGGARGGRRSPRPP